MKKILPDNRIIWIVAIIAAVSIPLFAKFREVRQSSQLESQDDKKLATSLPLSKGTYWIYQGPTKWTLDNSNKVAERTLTWKMEVVDTKQQGQYFIAVIKGHPGDLAWYVDGKERGNHIIGRKGTTKYYLLQGKKADELITNFKQIELTDKMFVDDDLILDFPLMQGKKFGEPDQVERPDNAYCWYVQSERSLILNDIKGLVSNPTVTQYELRFQTNPDHEIVKFVDGIGITAYQYVHHGTVSETNLHLIEFHKGVN